ncbi:uncharacterized protein LOC130667413 [Microplitis mediator]|uniref:uncharacterized protein LOC130667413 n=1 Tax=Microplitis mediator TaxID=375433 RepID=UPI0025553ED9|nr:uncharacterized protein LOC130667413 [Microplitis mediator]
MITMWIRIINWWLLFTYSFREIEGLIPLFNSENPIDSYKYQQMREIIKLCFSNRSNPLVLTDNLISIIDQDARKSITSTIIVINNKFKAKNIQTFNPSRPTYILSTDSNEQLDTFLREFESMVTWSIESLFFVVDFTDNNCCINASKVLQILWKKELLSSLFVCSEPHSDKIWLYAFNPYAPHAPHPWEEVKTVDKPDSRWTLYKRPYINDISFCQNLTFDKTKILDGYPLKTIGRPAYKKNWTSDEVYGKEVLKTEFPYFHGTFFSTLFSEMNATPVINFDDEGYFDKNESFGFLKLLVNGTSDIGTGLRRFYHVPPELIDTVKLYNEDGFLILTLKKKFELPLEVIEDYWTTDIIILSIATLLLTSVTIFINNNNSFRATFLDILRMILGAGIMTTLERFSMRIVFVIATVVLFILNPALGGSLSALMSNPERQSVENLQDLHTYKYHVYIHFVQKQFIDEENLWLGLDRKYLHFTNTTDVDCDYRVLNDSTAACIAFSTRQIRGAKKYQKQLHVSDSLIFKTYFTFWTRRNWALKNRVDQIVLRLTEAGIINHWNSKGFSEPLKKLRAKEKLEESSEYFQIQLENVLFAIIFFILGSIFGIIMFITEIYLKRQVMRLEPPERKLKLRQKIVIINKRIVILNKYIK